MWGGSLLGAAALAGASWAHLSDSRRARLVRQLAHDAVRKVPAPPKRPEPASWDNNAITLAWIGHATVLINFYGVHILTDPVFGARVGIDLRITTLGPKRYTAPALPLRELPPIDLLLLSHAHMDHLDLSTLRQLAKPGAVITARRTSEFLAETPAKGASELGWGEKARIPTARGDLQVEAFEVKHWGRRWPSDVDRGYNGYVLRREGRSLIFGGDTAYTKLFARLKQSGPYETAIMPIAAYNPWIRNHCTPEEAQEMADMAGARTIIPIHHSTYKLSDEPMEEPIQRLVLHLADQKERVGLHEIGATWHSA
jgi:L-ascorbate metabolism protein UlaG (beta-lactamase superfamily)